MPQAFVVVLCLRKNSEWLPRETKRWTTLYAHADMKETLFGQLLAQTMTETYYARRIKS